MSRHSPRHSPVPVIDPSIIGADTLVQCLSLQRIIKVDEICSLVHSDDLHVAYG